MIKQAMILVALAAVAARGEVTKHKVSMEWQDLNYEERYCVTVWSDGERTVDNDYRPWMWRARVADGTNGYKVVGYDTAVHALINPTQAVTRCYKDAKLMTIITNTAVEPVWARCSIVATNRTGVVARWTNSLGQVYWEHVPFDRATLLTPRAPDTNDVTGEVSGWQSTHVFRQLAKVVASNLCEEVWSDGSVRTNAYNHLKLGNRQAEARHVIIKDDGRVITTRLDGRVITNVLRRIQSGKVGQSIYARLDAARADASNALARVSLAESVAEHHRQTAERNAQLYAAATNSNAAVVNWLASQRDAAKLPTTKAIYNAIISKIKELSND